MMRRLAAALAALLLLCAPAGAACWQWSTTAGNNSTADPTINWSEGQSPSSVNDSARAMMARQAECRDDLSGKLVTAGTSTAYTLATNQAVGGNGIAATPADGTKLAFRPHAANGASATLRVDGGTAFPLQTAPGTAVASATMLLGTPYSVTFVSSASAWVLHDFYQTTFSLDTIGSTRGSILERGAGGWGIVTPGAAGTVWTSNGAGADPSYQAPTVVQPPHGYLTPVSLTPVITGDSAAATTIYYTPDIGNLVPIYNGSIFVQTVFAELTLALSAGSQASVGIYDVFVFSDSGTVRAAFGPSWSAGGGSVAAGSGARGTGAGSTELQKLNGLWTNKNSISAANNGATTYAIAANQGTYVGSVFVDASAGQVTQHRSFGQNRKWGIWNAYNRKTVILQMGDATASWSYSTNTVRQSRADTGNKVTVFCGLAEELIDVRAAQTVTADTSANSEPTIGIGVDSTTAFSGKRGKYKLSSIAAASNAEVVAAHVVMPILGLSNINFLETGSGSTTSTFNGGNDDMLLTAQWRG